MGLQLTGENGSSLQPYKRFYGRIAEQMPLLIAEGRDPASVAYVIGRRMEAPEDVRGTWQLGFDTGDGIAYGKLGDAVIVLDSPNLRELTPETRLNRGGMVLSDKAFEALKKRDGAVCLSADDKREAQGKGWKKQGSVWRPVNATVRKVWDALGRGRDLNDYAELVASSSGNDHVLQLYFDQGNEAHEPIVRPWYLSSINYDSDANSYLDNSCYGCLVGVASEVQCAREQALEARIASAVDAKHHW